MILNSMLPQSTFKIWGIPDKQIESFNQFEYLNRHPNAKKITPAIYYLNQLICEIYGITNFNFIEKSRKKVVKDGLFDQQILNLKHHFNGLSIQGFVDIIDYSNLSHIYLGFSDARFGKEYFRALLRNYRLKKKYAPRNFYSLVYPWQENLINPTNLFWQNKLLDYQEIRKTAKLFLDKNIKLFPEVEMVQKANKAFVICPKHDVSYDDFKFWANNNGAQLNEISKETIFIKQHRVSGELFPDKFSVKGMNFVTFNSPLMKILPLEILHLASSNVTIATSPSAVMAIGKQFFVIPPIDKKDKKDYGLLISRLSQNAKISFIGISK